MNPSLLPREMNIENQNRMLKELETIPDRLFELKKAADAHTINVLKLNEGITEREFELERARAAVIESPQFAELKNDSARKAFVFSMTALLEQDLLQAKNEKAFIEARHLPFKAEYDAMHQKLWALKSASELTAAYMNFAAAGELP